MTALQELINQLTEQSKQDFSDKTLDEKLKMLEQEFSVKLRNSNSSADNTSDEQLHSDGELMSKIKSLLNDNLYYDFDSSEIINKDEVSEEIIKLFKKHRNTVSTATKYSIDVNADAMRLPGKTVVLERTNEVTELEFEIMQELVAFGNWGYNDKLEFESEELDQAVESIAKLLKTYQKCDSTAVKQQDDNLVDEVELASQIEAIALKHCTGTFKWCSEISMSENEFSNFTAEVITLFRNSIEPVFRALNDSDE